MTGNALPVGAGQPHRLPRLQVRDENTNAICADAAVEHRRDHRASSINSRVGPVFGAASTPCSGSPARRHRRYGLAASAWPFLLARAPGKRYLLPRASISPSGGIGGNPASRSRPSSRSHLKRQLAGLIANQTGRAVEEQDRARLRPRPLVHRPGGTRYGFIDPRLRARVPDQDPDAPSSEDAAPMNW